MYVYANVWNAHAMKLKSRLVCITYLIVDTEVQYYPLIGCGRSRSAGTLPRWTGTWTRFVSFIDLSQAIFVAFFIKWFFFIRDSCFVFCLVIATSGFGGRGVLPGVATGTGLNPKSSKGSLMSVGSFLIYLMSIACHFFYYTLQQNKITGNTAVAHKTIK